MSKRIAVVETRQDLIEFLQDQLELRGYQVVVVDTVEAAMALRPAADLTLYDFGTPVDLPDLLEYIAEELSAPKKKKRA